MKINHKLIKLSLATLACAVITACSSGGGSSSSTYQKPSAINDNAPTSDTSSSSSNNSNNTSTDASTGSVTTLYGLDNDAESKSKALNDKGITTITVDGKPIRVDFRDLNLVGGGWSSINNTQTCCGTFTDVRFGKFGGEYDEDKEYIFYNGNPTAVMPTTGTASYKGKMLITGDAKQFDDEDYLKGSSHFTADFANKTLKGTLTADSLQPISIEAKISGNSFDGSAKSADFSSQAIVDGKFYGNNAKELAGKFMSSSFGKDDASWGGVFGAAK